MGRHGTVGLMTIALDLDRNGGVDFGLNLSDGKAILAQFPAQIASIKCIKWP